MAPCIDCWVLRCDFSIRVIGRLPNTAGGTPTLTNRIFYHCTKVRQLWRNYIYDI